MGNKKDDYRTYQPENDDGQSIVYSHDRIHGLREVAFGFSFINNCNGANVNAYFSMLQSQK